MNIVQPEQNNAAQHGRVIPEARPGSELDENVIEEFKERAKGRMPDTIPFPLHKQ